MSFEAVTADICSRGGGFGTGVARVQVPLSPRALPSELEIRLDSL